jgi:ABC-type multidrug transport system ATPase subunit
LEFIVITTANISIQFGVKPLFENISVKFGHGNRYGLIGANGSGKSTLMKILGGELEPTAGNIKVDVDERLGKLRQDQFAFEKYTVIDSSLATRIIDMTTDGLINFKGSYDEYLRSQGIEEVKLKCAVA